MKRRLAMSFTAVLLLMGIAIGAAPTHPKFELVSIDNKLYSSLGLRGRAVLISFFARQCQPCRMEVPFINELYAKYPDTLTILGIAFLESNYDKLIALIKEWGMMYPIIPDPDGRVAGAFDQYVFPGSYLMNYRGEIVGTYKGLSEQFNRDIINKIEQMEPQIQEYRQKGPLFYVQALTEKGADANGRGKQWQTNISGWLKGRSIRIAANKKDADYVISGSVSRDTDADMVEIVISNLGGVEEMRFSDRISSGREDELREKLLRRFKDFPYVIR